MPNPPSRHRRRLDPRWLALPLLGAAMLAGAMSGEEIGSAPVIARHADPPPIAVRAAEFDGAAGSTTARRLPDHYPLVTPSGTVPVAALASHGRYRDRHETGIEQPGQSGFDTPAEWEISADEIDRLEQWEPGPHPAPRAPKSSEAPALAETLPASVSTVSVTRGAGAPGGGKPAQDGETVPPARSTALPVED